MSPFILLALAPAKAFASSVTHYIDLWLKIPSDIFKETASGEGVALHMKDG